MAAVVVKFPAGLGGATGDQGEGQAVRAIFDPPVAGVGFLPVIAIKVTPAGGDRCGDTTDSGFGRRHLDGGDNVADQAITLTPYTRVKIEGHLQLFPQALLAKP